MRLSHFHANKALFLATRIFFFDCPLPSAIAVDYNGDTYVAWKDLSTGNYEIFFSRSNDGGHTWSNELNLSNNSADSVKPSIELDEDGNIYVLWFELKDNHRIQEIYFTRSTDGGVTFSEPFLISNVPNLSSMPVIAIDENNNLNVAWANFPINRYREKILFTRSIDGGDSWTVPVTASGTNTAAHYPSIAVGIEGYVYLVWEEEINGKRKILFSHSY
jgi:hypothetical protein